MTVSKQSIASSLKLSTTTALTSIAAILMLGSSVQMTLWICIGYGLVTFISVFPVYCLSNHCGMNRGTGLTGGKFMTAALLLLVLALTVSVYSSLVYNFRWTDYFRPSSHLNEANLVGSFWVVFICMGILFIIQLFLIGDGEPASVVENTETTSEKSACIEIQDESKSHKIKVDLNSFLYAESNANYLKLFCFDGELKEQTIRLTIKALEERLAAYPRIIRCHRAYIANLSNVQYLKGNSTKGELHFNGSPVAVPVSKTYVELIKAALAVNK